MNKILHLAIIGSLLIFSCNNSSQNSTKKNIELKEKGQKIALATQTELLKNVSNAVQTGGPTYAIEFCNIEAMPITDSLSKTHNVSISRISNENRNELNMLSTEEEKKLWIYYEKNWDKFKQHDTVVQYKNGKYTYYKPIMIAMPTCLKCHGEPYTDIDSTTLTMIDALYPNDKAKHYKLEDFRGLWKVQF